MDARSDERVVRHQQAGSSGQRAWHSGVECSLKTEETDAKRVRVTFWISRSETASVNSMPGFSTAPVSQFIQLRLDGRTPLEAIW